MKRIFISISVFFLMSLKSFGFENCVLFADGKLSDISIEHNDVINVYPLITLYNKKNTLIIQPLKIGKTRFCILKNNKEKLMFNVEVLENKTIVNYDNNCSVFSIDEPPQIVSKISESSYFIDNIEIDEPPLRRGI